MKWPEELFEAFLSGMEIEPNAGFTPREVVQRMLDGAAAIAVKVANNNPKQLESAYKTPYTPVGQMTVNCMDGTAKKFTLNGPVWVKAVDKLYDYVRQHTEEIVKETI